MEDAKAAEFNSGIRDQAVGHFIKKSLNNLTGKIAGKTVLFGNLSNQVGLDHDQLASIHFAINSERLAVSFAFSASICLKRNGRSEVEPVTSVMATSMSWAMIVFRSSFFALASADFTTASAKTLRRSRK